MELRIQIDKKTGLVLLAAVVAGMVGGALMTCIMMHHGRGHGYGMERGGYGERMMGFDEGDFDGGNFYYSTEVSPTAGVEAMPAAKAMQVNQ